MVLNTGSYWSLNIYTDSMYVKNCMEKWAQNWIQLGWKRKVGNQIKDNLSNLDLIKTLYTYSCIYPVKYHHVRSHKKAPSENSKSWHAWYGNDMADKMACEAMDKVRC